MKVGQKVNRFGFQSLEFVDVEENDVGEFDYLMGELYDCGDISLDNVFGGKKVCWIATNF